MLPANPQKVGYIVKRYPRYSETFIVNEILAHEEAGLDLEIFALRPPSDTHFQPNIAKVKAPVTYLSEQGKMAELWTAITEVANQIPGSWHALALFEQEDARTIHQALQLARAIKARGITHLHAHFATSATAVARVAARLTHIPYSFTAHAKDIFHESVDAQDLRRKLQDASTIVTVSDYNLGFLQEAYGEAAAQVARIYNGLDLTAFPYETPADRPPRILAVGRLVEKKGFGDLIDACAILAGQGVVFDCKIIGSGDQEADLRGRIEQHRLSDQVTLMGPRPQSEIVTLLRDASVFAAPCVIGQDGNRDGLPTVLLESMALGTPCISTDVTGIPEILLDEETGLMTPQNNPAALAEAIKRLLDSSALRVRLAQNARRLIENRFDIHRNATMLRALFTPWPVTSGDAIPDSHVQIEEQI